MLVDRLPIVTTARPMTGHRQYIEPLTKFRRPKVEKEPKQ